MITSLELSNRIHQFFDVLFAANKTDYGFNADSAFAFIEDRQNEAVRTTDRTILYYRIESNEKAGNAVASDTQKFNKKNGKEEIIAFRKLTVVINILSKSKGMAQDAMNAFQTFVESSRRQTACYADPFPLVLVNFDKIPLNLTELEEGAWVERMQRNLYFRYSDITTIGDIQFTQQPETVEDVKGIIDFTINLKN